MCKLVFICIFNVLILSALVQTWDIAVGIKDQIEFFKENGSIVGTARQQFQDVRTLAYDSIQQTLYLVDNNHKNVSIFAFHMSGTRNLEHILKKHINNSISGIAVDPVTMKLFWTVQSNNSIFWMSTKSGSKNSGVGSVFLTLKGEAPQQIVVDSCRGKVYWINSKNKQSTIERASIDGSNHEVVIKDGLSNPSGLTLHQGTTKIFWCDKKNNVVYNIESADLDGTNRQVIHTDNYHRPYHIAIGKKALYWTDWTFRSVWKLPFDNLTSDAVAFQHYNHNSPTGIIVNDDLLEQAENVPECANLSSAIINKLKAKKLNDDIISDVEVPQYILDYCKDYEDDNDTEKCKNGASIYPYALCYNHCFNGTCYIDTDKTPKCRCHRGFFGERCQEDVCHNHCLNDGICNVDEVGAVTCLCMSNWTGSRCEISKEKTKPISCISNDNNKTEKKHTVNSSAETPQSLNLSIKDNKLESNYSNEDVARTINHVAIREKPIAAFEETKQYAEPKSTNMEVTTAEQRNAARENNEREIFIETDPDSQIESINEAQCSTVIICLSLLTLAFCASTVVLTFKVITLKKRPRINKKFIVKKNVTPLTSRPQCEVTIENCCNMNICETPCFEPSDFIEQVQEASKKEEKKNLLLNMQHSED